MNTAAMYQLIRVHYNFIPDELESIILDKNIVDEKRLDLEKRTNMLNILAYFYYDYIINNPSDYDPSYEWTTDGYTYYRSRNMDKNYYIRVAKEGCVSPYFECVNCKTTIESKYRIRANCNHLICTTCFDSDLYHYNLPDKDNCVEHPCCAKCESAITHIYVPSEYDKDVYTPLEYGIKPWFVYIDEPDIEVITCSNSDNV
jgi:hypothetical protein